MTGRARGLSQTHQIERAVTRLSADLGLTMPSGAGQRFLPSLAGPYRDEGGR